MQKESFDKLYEQAVIEALLMLGPHISSIIVLYVNEKYSIRLIETANKPNVLTDALKSTMDGGTRIIQRRILRILYDKMGIEPRFNLTINFEEKIVEAKQEFERMEGREKELVK